jgi:hypothetical protein
VYGSASDNSTNAAGGGPNQRYGYLSGRLRNRQITMEEATELFALMQALIARANEAARIAALRAAAPTGPLPPPGGAPPPMPRAPPVASSADDFLLVGLLAMGAGAGLLAALSKRIGDPNPPAPSGSARSNSSSSSP